MIALRHLRAGGGDCVGRSIARWSSFMHVSVYLEEEPPCQFPVFQTTHFGALASVRLLFHELLGLQLRRLLRWLLLWAPHHSSRRMALRYFTLSSSLCAETIGGAWEVRLEKNMERVRAMVSISFYLYEVGERHDARSGLETGD